MLQGPRKKSPRRSFAVSRTLPSRLRLEALRATSVPEEPWHLAELALEGKLREQQPIGEKDAPEYPTPLEGVDHVSGNHAPDRFAEAQRAAPYSRCVKLPRVANDPAPRVKAIVEGVSEDCRPMIVQLLREHRQPFRLPEIVVASPREVCELGMQLSGELEGSPPGPNEPQAARVARVMEAPVVELPPDDAARLVRGRIVQHDDPKLVEALPEERGKCRAKIDDLIVKRDSNRDPRHVPTSSSGRNGACVLAHRERDARSSAIRSTAGFSIERSGSLENSGFGSIRSPKGESGTQLTSFRG